MKKSFRKNLLFWLLFTVIFFGVFAGLLRIENRWRPILLYLWYITGACVALAKFSSPRMNPAAGTTAQKADRKPAIPEMNNPELPYLFLLQNLNSRIYQVFFQPGRLLFLHVGTELSGVDKEKVAWTMPRDETVAQTEKSFILERDQLTKITLKMKEVRYTPYPNSGTLNINGRLYVVLLKVPQKQIESLFSGCGIPLQADEKFERSETKKTENENELKQWNHESQNSKTLGLMRTITRWLSGIGLIASLVFAFNSGPNDFWAAAAMISYSCIVILSLSFPQYYILWPSGGISEDDGINLLGCFLVVIIGVLGSAASYELLNELMAIGIGTAVSVIFIILYFLRLKQMRHRFWPALSFCLLLILGSWGAVGGLNFLLDSGEPKSEPAVVMDAYIEKPTSRMEIRSTYHLVVGRTDGTRLDMIVGSDTYNTTDIDELGRLYVYPGALGLSYVKYVPPEE